MSNNASNFTVSPPFACNCPVLPKDISCVPWNQTNHIEVAVVAGTVFGVASLALSMVLRRYFNNDTKQATHIPFDLESIPETQEIPSR